jgi:large subunit ribosomal protein L17
MRHQKHGRKFGRKSASRHALFSNLVASLIEHERIQTTDAKAKELRRLAERTISWATSVGNLVGPGASDKKKDADDEARVVHAMRMASRVLKHKPTLHKLFNEVGPRFVGRPGGYTRIMKVGNRHGDAAPVSIIELVDRAQPETAAASGPESKGAKGKAAEAAPAPKKASPKPKAED